MSVQVHRLANALCSLGHDLTCFSLSPKPSDALYHHVHLHSRITNKILGKFVPAALFRTVRTGGFDCVHFHGDDYLCDSGKRRIRTFYGSAFFEALHAGTLGRALYQGLFYGLEWISLFRKGTKVGISKNTRRALPLITRIIPCGVDTRVFFPSGEKSPNPRLLFIGDLNSRKRGGLLIDIFHRGLRPHFPSAELVVVGPEPCSGEGIIYLGQISQAQLIQEYRKAWIYCMISSYEGFGVPALEAMACGTPVVATSNAGIREFVHHDLNGLVCTQAALSSTIMRALSSEELRRRLSDRGVVSAKSFDIIRVAEMYLELYTGSAVD